MLRHVWWAGVPECPGTVRGAPDNPVQLGDHSVDAACRQCQDCPESVMRALGYSVAEVEVVEACYDLILCEIY